MKRFLKKTLLILIAVFIPFFVLCFFVDGTTDPFYMRFTSPPQKNLIIGTSRAAQGLQPRVFDSVLGIDMYNYSFTIMDSPFGKVYLESIKRKHNKNKNGNFVVTVDPWAISSWSNNPNDLKQFRENDRLLAKTKYVNLNPNFEYIIDNLGGNFKDIFIPPSDNLFLHSNGWLEVKDIDMDSLTVNKRISRKIDLYKNTHLPKTKLSQTRVDYLLKTIKYFKKYGQVYLVRLPVHPQMMNVENKLLPNFDEVITDAISESDDYLDLTSYNEKFSYTDGNHLYKSSGKEVSLIIANWINREN